MVYIAMFTEEKTENSTQKRYFSSSSSSTFGEDISGAKMNLKIKDSEGNTLYGNNFAIN